MIWKIRNVWLRRAALVASVPAMCLVAVVCGTVGAVAEGASAARHDVGEVVHIWRTELWPDIPKLWDSAYVPPEDRE